jgi:hypothetical protein
LLTEPIVPLWSFAIGPSVGATHLLTLNSFKQVRSIVKNVLSGNSLQEFLAEMATSVISYTLGFEQTSLSWHKKHGPDQVARHATGVWGIFEAKGGTSRLSHSSTSKGPQMQGLWISKWLEDIISRNRRTEAGEQLRDAFEAHSRRPIHCQCLLWFRDFRWRIYQVTELALNSTLGCKNTTAEGAAHGSLERVLDRSSLRHE